MLRFFIENHGLKKLNFNWWIKTNARIKRLEHEFSNSV